MKFVILLLFLSISFCFGLSNCLEVKRKSLVLQGNFPVGRGSSILVKLGFLKMVKEKLIHEYAYKDKNIKIKLKNLQMRRVKRKELRNEFKPADVDHTAFNIFLIRGNNKRVLVGTSDIHQKTHYCEYLQTGLGREEKEECINFIAENIELILNKN